MNWKEYGREQSWPSSLEGIRKTTETSVMTIGVQARFEIGTSCIQVKNVAA
jgi:hypothetical protein